MLTSYASIPLVAAIAILVYLHRRNIRRQRQEDLNDPHKSLDFGLGPSQESTKNLIDKEKGGRFARQQMSMDMNLTSPYLLPPEVHNSRESLNSLSKSLHGAEDPYRPVTQYANSDVASLRSPSRAQDPFSPRASVRSDMPPPSPGPYGFNSPPRNNGPRSPIHPPEPSHARRDFQRPGEFSPPPSAPPTGPLPPIGMAVSTPPGQDEKSPIQEPPAAAQRDVLPRLSTSPPQPSPADSGVAVDNSNAPSNPFEKPEAQEVETPVDSHGVGLGLSTDPENARASIQTSTTSNSGPSSPILPPKSEPSVPTAPRIEVADDGSDYGEDGSRQARRRSDSPGPRFDDQDGEERRGRTMQRTSQLIEQQQQARKSLAVPQQDGRRLSVGYRPLPPDEILDSEDPEYRANRIRSFYKEYFDETKPEDRPPVPPVPPQHQQRHQHQQSNASYYEDYDPAYAPDAPYFDPTTNSFVMPFAQPVSRRAMTPPPSGNRFPGPRGPPQRPRAGSQAGMRLPPNIRGPPRPGSSVSNRPPNNSRPGTAMSGMRSASAMSGAKPKKPVPPPADLQTLPTPAKLTDDTSILNPIDFAPPETFAERARGRSQSPLGERRPYKMPVAHSPLANAYEELPALPSPYVVLSFSVLFPAPLLTCKLQAHAPQVRHVHGARLRAAAQVCRRRQRSQRDRLHPQQPQRSVRASGPGTARRRRPRQPSSRRRGLHASGHGREA